MDYDTKYCNHKWECFAENILLKWQIDWWCQRSGAVQVPLGHLYEIDLIDVHFFCKIF